MKNCNKLPLVSIIIPVYNGENYVEEAIKSALNQTYKNIEVIVVNDGSTDNTENIIKTFGDKIVYIKKKNGGVSSALNIGIKKMKGEYFSWLSHDDLYCVEKIEKSLHNNLDYHVICCNYDFVNKEGDYLYSNVISDDLLNKNSKFEYLFNYVINGCSLLIKKDVFDNVGLFREDLPTTQDFDMWFRILREYDFKFVNTVLVHSRVHAEQGSALFLNSHVEECEKLWINFINSLTNTEMQKIYGSEMDFYYQLNITLKKYVNYPRVFLFLDEKYLSCIKKDKKILTKYLKKNYGTLLSDKIIKVTTNSKIKIAFGAFGNWEDLGGLNKVVANVSSELADIYDVFIFHSGDKDKGYDSKNVTFIKYEFDNNLKKIYELMYFLGIKLYINVYNCSYDYLVLSKYLKDRDIKVIAWNHEYYFSPFKNRQLLYGLDKRLEIFNELDVVLWLTSSSNGIYRIFNNNGIVMHNYIEYKDKRSDFVNNTIVAIGRFDDVRKNVEGLITLAYFLKKNNLRIKIEVYGSYDMELIGEKNNISIGQLLKKYELTNENIEFMGFTKNIHEIYKNAKLHILLSRDEGFGLVLLEAANYGLPSICYNDSGFEDIVTNGENGYLVERDDYESLVEIIKKIYNDNDLFNFLSKNAIKKCEYFKKEKIINNWKELIKIILNNDKKNITTIINKKFLCENATKEQIQNYFFQYNYIVNDLIKNNSSIPTRNESNLIADYDKVSFVRHMFRKIVPLKIRHKMKNVKVFKKIKYSDKI